MTESEMTEQAEINQAIHAREEGKKTVFSFMALPSLFLIQAILIWFDVWKPEQYDHAFTIKMTVIGGFALFFFCSFADSK